MSQSVGNSLTVLWYLLSHIAWTCFHVSRPYLGPPLKEINTANMRAVIVKSARVLRNCNKPLLFVDFVCQLSALVACMLNFVIIKYGKYKPE